MLRVRDFRLEGLVFRSKGPGFWIQVGSSQVDTPYRWLTAVSYKGNGAI